MSGSFDDLLAEAEVASMEVDTSFLNRYGRGGGAAADPPSRSSVTETSRAENPKTEQVAEPEPRTEDDDKPAVPEVPEEQPAPVIAEPEPEAQIEVDLDRELRHRRSDRRDEAQGSGARSGGGGGSDTMTLLPRTGFAVMTAQKQPMIRGLSDPMVSALRGQVRDAAVRELGVSVGDARDFAERLSQSALVMAFLMAQLDVRVETDPGTARAAELLRSRDPLLGAVLARVIDLEKGQLLQQGLLAKVTDSIDEVRETTYVVEQSLAYSIADRTENFLRGSHDIHAAPITHKEAVALRDRARDQTRRQHKLEVERDGRPIR